MSSFTSNIDYQNIIRQLQALEATRREDALARYAEANQMAADLSQQVGAMGTYGEAEAQLDMVGQAARTRIAENQQQQFAMADQDLTTRGLGNTTIRTAAQRGTNQDALRANNELDDQLAAQRSGIRERRAGMEFSSGVNQIDTLLSRQDEGIDYGMYANLLQSAAATPTGKQQITIGPGGSSSLGTGKFSQAQQGSTGGGGGGGGGGTGVSLWNNQGFQKYLSGGGGGSFTNAAGSQGTSGTQQKQANYNRSNNYSSGYATKPSGGSQGGPITSYGGSAGNSAESAFSGYAFGPDIKAGTMATMPTGGGQPIFQMASGAITNDPTQIGPSAGMQAGAGAISGGGSVMPAAGGSNPMIDNTGDRPTLNKAYTDDEQAGGSTTSSSGGFDPTGKSALTGRVYASSEEANQAIAGADNATIEPVPAGDGKTYYQVTWWSKT